MVLTNHSRWPQQNTLFGRMNENQSQSRAKKIHTLTKRFDLWDLGSWWYTIALLSSFHRMFVTWHLCAWLHFSCHGRQVMPTLTQYQRAVITIYTLLSMQKPCHCRKINLPVLGSNHSKCNLWSGSLIRETVALLSQLSFWNKIFWWKEAFSSPSY